jgi:hypothetical protein
VSSDAKYKIPVRDDEGKELGETSVFVARADGTTALIVAHGAGGTMDTPSIRSLQ